MSAAWRWRARSRIISASCPPSTKAGWASSSTATRGPASSDPAAMRFVAVLFGAGLLVGAASAAPTPRFAAEVSPVRWADLRFSYRAGCPVGPAELRTVRLSYWDFDGQSQTGSIVVNRRVTGDIVTVFRRLYAARFPIRRL